MAAEPGFLNVCFSILLASQALSQGWAAAIPLEAQGAANHGLVAVGRVPADSFDARGERLDTLGGIGSGMYFDAASWTVSGDSQSGMTYRGNLYALPDRGFGDGTQNYLPRVQTFQLAVTPYVGPGPVPQTQILLTNTSSLLLSREGQPLTGFDAGDATFAEYPKSTAGSLGAGRHSLDPEGIVRLPDGGFFISDEYGPFIYRFDAQGALLKILRPPASILPKRGNYPGTNYFSATNSPTSGRRNNRGLEGLSITPDGKRLFAMLQSPTIQDVGAGNSGRNTRLLVFDIEAGSPTEGLPIAEYVYQLTLKGNAEGNRNTPVSEVFALNREQVLVLERDSGQGFGTGTNLASTYKQIVLATTVGASNIIDSPYDLERSAPGQTSLAAGTLPQDIAPMPRLDLVNILDAAQLAKFGLNNSTNQDQNTLSEKWEALSLMPLKDPAAPNDFLLLVMNDNDFKASVVIHNGVEVGRNTEAVDNMILGYRVTLPMYGAPAPTNSRPSIALVGPTNAVLGSPVTFTVTARAYDQDGRITKVEFWSGATRLSEDTTYPFQHTFNEPPLGPVSLRAVAFDNEGASVTSENYTTTIVGTQQRPTVALTFPPTGTTLTAPATFTLTAAVADPDGWITRVEFFRDSNRLAILTNGVSSLAVSNQPLGSLTYSAIVTDNHGLMTTSAPVALSVVRNLNTAPVRLQILHASDMEAGLASLSDAPAFSSVLAALRSSLPTNTLVLSSGDTYIPGPFFNAAGDVSAGYNLVSGRADISMLNAMGFQVSAFGNHEFDLGTAQIRSLLLRDTTAGYPGALYPYLSANLNFAPDSSLSSLVSADGLNAASLSNRIARSCVIGVAGQLVGVVGATTVELRQISSPGAVGIINDLVGAIQPAVDALLAQGVNKIILLAHLQQFANEFQLAQQLRDVDIIIAGGSHAVFAGPRDRLRAGDVASAEYPTWFTSTSGEPVAVVNTGANYRYVGRLLIDFTPAGLISAVDPVSGPYATDPEGVQALGNVPPNPAVQAIVNNLGAIIAAKDGAVFGRTEFYLNGLRATVRTEESNLGNLTADANLWWGRQVDPTVSVSLKNGGGIRDSIGAVLGFGGGAEYVPPLANPSAGKKFGDISQLDIENSLRFNNGLSLITLSAQQLRDAIEWGVAAAAPGATPGQFPQVGGIWFGFVPTNSPMTFTRATNNGVVAITGIANPGSRVRTLVARRGDGSLDLVVENGKLVGEPGRPFRMITLDFLASGGDSYFPLTLGLNRLDLAPLPAGATVRTFSTPGAEQWALAAYLTNIQTYGQADVAASGDQRTQSLVLRDDTVGAPLLTRIVPGNGVEVTFTTLPGKRYQVVAANEIEGPWVLVSPTAISGTGSLVTHMHVTHPGSHRFYRVWRVD
jgi:2',3'-cyclic-nucleotide 2'-phosphodiesterase (5'-nucleotidase family)